MAHRSPSPPGQGLDAFLRWSLAVPGPCSEERYLLAGGRGDPRQAFLETRIREGYAVRAPSGDVRLTPKGQRRALRAARRRSATASPIHSGAADFDGGAPAPTQHGEKGNPRHKATR